MIETTTRTAYAAATVTASAGAVTWSLSEIAAAVGIVASILGIISTVITTFAVVRHQRKRTEEQQLHNEKLRDIERSKDD